MNFFVSSHNKPHPHELPCICVHRHIAPIHTQLQTRLHNPSSPHLTCMESRNYNPSKSLHDRHQTTRKHSNRDHSAASTVANDKAHGDENPSDTRAQQAHRLHLHQSGLLQAHASSRADQQRQLQHLSLRRQQRRGPRVRACLPLELRPAVARLAKRLSAVQAQADEEGRGCYGVVC